MKELLNKIKWLEMENENLEISIKEKELIVKDLKNIFKENEAKISLLKNEIRDTLIENGQKKVIVDNTILKTKFNAPDKKRVLEYAEKNFISIPTIEKTTATVDLKQLKEDIGKEKLNELRTQSLVLEVVDNG